MVCCLRGAVLQKSDSDRAIRDSIAHLKSACVLGPSEAAAAAARPVLTYGAPSAVPMPRMDASGSTATAPPLPATPVQSPMSHANPLFSSVHVVPGYTSVGVPSGPSSSSSAVRVAPQPQVLEPSQGFVTASPPHMQVMHDVFQSRCPLHGYVCRWVCLQMSRTEVGAGVGIVNARSSGPVSAGAPPVERPGAVEAHGEARPSPLPADGLYSDLMTAIGGQQWMQALALVRYPAYSICLGGGGLLKIYG